MEQAIQLVGALTILGAFIANQRFGMSSESVPYLAANAVGSLILAGVATVNGDAGFILLESVWGLVSLISLAGRLRGGRPASI